MYKTRLPRGRRLITNKCQTSSDIIFSTIGSLTLTLLNIKSRSIASARLSANALLITDKQPWERWPTDRRTDGQMDGGTDGHYQVHYLLRFAVDKYPKRWKKILWSLNPWCTAGRGIILVDLCCLPETSCYTQTNRIMWELQFIYTGTHSYQVTNYISLLSLPWYDAPDEWLFVCSGDTPQSDVFPGRPSPRAAALPTSLVQPSPKPRALIHKNAKGENSLDQNLHRVIKLHNRDAGFRFQRKNQ